MPKSKEFIESGSESGSDAEARPKKKQKVEGKKPQKKGADASSSKATGEEEKKFALGKLKFAVVSEFRGKKFVNIREYYDADDGSLKPGKKGIALTVEQWKKLQEVTDEVDAALEEL